MEEIVIFYAAAALLGVAGAGLLASVFLDGSYLNAWIESHIDYRIQKRKAKKEMNKERKSTKKILDVIFSDKNINVEEIISKFRENNIDIPLKIDKIKNPRKKEEKLKKFITNYPKKFPMRDNPEKDHGVWYNRLKYSYEKSEQLSKMFEILLRNAPLDENKKKQIQWAYAPKELYVARDAIQVGKGNNTPKEPVCQVFDAGDWRI